jgi:hypothetical protein
MRYGIVEHHEDGDDSDHPYFVVDSQSPTLGEGTLGPKFSEAEATIIAWSLSAVASGLVLEAVDSKGSVHARYDSTVRGIAP